MQPPPVSEGDLCSIAGFDDAFRVAKVLKVDDRAVHVRVYANRFSRRPASLDVGSLELGTIHDDTVGIGHVPVASDAFAAWEPRVIGQAAVDPEELEGYEIWREIAAEGEAGVWSGQRPPVWEQARERFRRA